MSRETKIIKSGKHEIEVFAYLNVRETSEMRKAILSGANPTTDGKMSFSGDAIAKSLDLILKLALVSVDGNNENPFDSFMELPGSVYDDVMLELNPMITGSNFQKGG